MLYTWNVCNIVNQLYVKQTNKQTKTHFKQKVLSWITALSWQRGLHNSVKLWAMLCRAIQDGWVIAESSDKTWSTGGGSTPVYLLWEPHEPYKRLEKYDTERWTPQVWRCPLCYWGREEEITNSPRMNEAAGPMWIGCLVVGASGDESKIWCCKEQHCIRT